LSVSSSLLSHRVSRALGLGAALFVVLSAASLAHAQQMQRRDLELQIGEQQSLPADGVRSYSEGVAGIADIRVSRETGQFIVLGQRAGQTSLLLIMEDGSQIQYRIVVTGAEAATTGVSERDNIRIDFYFVQVSDEYSHKIGLGWPAFIGGAGVMRFTGALDLTTSTLTSAQLLVTNQPLPRLDLLQSTGWARIARQAALITVNGNQAIFNSGGEVNVSVSAGMSASIQAIKFGSQITVLPNYDRGTGRVELRIVTDISDLTDDRGTGLPGRTVSHLETLVNLEMGQAIMLAGIQADAEGSSRTGLPGLSQIPIFGVLFGTHAARSEQTRNVLFIVPTVVDAVSARSRDAIGDAMQIYQDFNGGAEDVLLFAPIHSGGTSRAPSGAGDTSTESDADAGPPPPPPTTGTTPRGASGGRGWPAGRTTN
jgi:pilus assembly protein CpaC